MTVRISPSHTETMRLRAFAVDSAARYLAGRNLIHTDQQAAQILPLADRLYQYILSGQPEPLNPVLADEVKHGYSFQALLASAKRNNAEQIALSRQWDIEQILAGFINAGYVHARLDAPLGETGVRLYPGPMTND